MRAQKKAMEAQILANKAERAKAMSMGKKAKNTGPVLTDAEKAKRNKENMDRIRKRMQFLQMIMSFQSLQFQPFLILKWFYSFHPI